MNDSANHRPVENLAYTVLAQLAPDELTFFQATSAAYFQNPRAVLTSGEGNDEKLGFGLGEVTPLLTPIGPSVRS